MDLLIPDNWLREFLKTKATSREVQKYLSLGGPTVDRIRGVGKDAVYEVEVTTNRPDAMSVFGIAREAAAILPRYGVGAKFTPLVPKPNINLSKKVPYLNLKVEEGLASRSAAILLKNVKIMPSPKKIQDRLIAVGERPLNNVVDISNYLMHEIGQPVHAFDWDKIAGKKMVMRKSRKGETITTLDNKTYKLPAGGIVIEDGEGKLIDMPGIMGGLNSAIDDTTKNVLLFVQTYNSKLIRDLAMRLDKWSAAARLYEKNLDPELVTLALARGVDLFVEVTGASPAKTALDLYFEKPKVTQIELTQDFINSKIGIEIPAKEMSTILSSLGFEVKWSGKALSVLPPSFRAADTKIPEDVVEEIARVYGYQNIPGKLMAGELPTSPHDNKFKFENKVKQILVGLGGSEVYTLSLVSREEGGNSALKLANPLGSDTEYLRTSLKPTLLKAMLESRHWEGKLHLFEMSHVYRAKKGDLPNETMVLAGITRNYKLRQVKGMLEVLSEKLHLKTLPDFNLMPIDENTYYYEVEVGKLYDSYQPYPTYQGLPQYPAQIEDITLEIPSSIKVGEVFNAIKSAKLVSKTELTSVYKNSYTFRIWFQDSKRTLTDKEVSSAREKLLSQLSKNFGATTKV